MGLAVCKVFTGQPILKSTDSDGLSSCFTSSLTKGNTKISHSKRRVLQSLFLNLHLLVDSISSACKIHSEISRKPS